MKFDFTKCAIALPNEICDVGQSYTSVVHNQYVFRYGPVKCGQLFPEIDLAALSPFVIPDAEISLYTSFDQR